ncbi:MAG TPA: 16S rRNA (adenine(1518)-N(6)/adenine(1519)-N(6))-dimethyltransferase RsmA [Steroidobacteraceae bacterium]|nr:16S rRNA (adenine(1518)-N(6)/adenine(1519)-N(6))-dimethyltransferase RsmA [Steroidobacteraceae bacterium]
MTVSRFPARKRFGQHFLHDPGVIERIVRAVAPRPGDRLVEIGPGRGALTGALLAAAGSLDAVEVDRGLAAELRERYAGNPSFRLHEADALRLDFGALARERGGRLRIVGNLPYNISTPLLFHLLEHAPYIADLHVMLQKEVVDRMVARPGTPEYGRLTVMLAPWVTIERLFDVGPGAFQPPPRVWSAVARVNVRPEPAFAVGARFAPLVAAAFSQRRKTLRNALRAHVDEHTMRAAGIDPGARPETLTPEQFGALANSAARL